MLPETTKQGQLSTVTREETPLSRCVTEPTAAYLDEKILLSHISNLYQQVLFKVGRNQDVNDILLTAKVLIEDIRKSFSDMSLTEISIAFDRGLQSIESEQYRDVSPLGLRKWLTDYRYSRIKEDIEKQRKELAKPKMQIPSIEEQQKTRTNLLKNAFEDYKEGKDMRLPAHIIFDCLTGVFSDPLTGKRVWLKEKALIKLSEERKEELMKLGRQKLLIKQQKLSNTPLSVDKPKYEIKAIRKTAEGIIAKLTADDTSDLKSVIRHEAMEVAVEQYFDGLIEMEIPIEEAIA